jgi:hypothetical protein
VFGVGSDVLSTNRESERKFFCQRKHRKEKKKGTLNEIKSYAQPRLITLTSFSSARSRTPRFEASASSTTRANSRSIQTTTMRANFFASSFPLLLLLFRNRVLERREAARRRKSSLYSLRFAGKTRRAAGRTTSACLDALYIYIYICMYTDMFVSRAMQM